METPAALRAIVAIMRQYPAPWFVCGGWAIDLFLDRETRAHKDVDIGILRADQLRAQQFLADRGWTLQIAHQGELTPWEAGDSLTLPLHTIWGSHPACDPDFLEILLNEGDAACFRFRRDPAITRERLYAFLQTAAGVPYLAPEIALLYKSAHADLPGNAADFHAALPALSAAQREWLQDALIRTQPEHAWLPAFMGA